MRKLVLALLIAGTTSAAVAEESVHRCRGLWTNSCIGTWQHVDRWDDTYQGDTYVGDDQHVQQRPFE